MSLDTIPSIINDDTENLDYTKPFTFIEFIKLFEYSKEKDSEFFTLFNQYLHKWGEKRKSDDGTILNEFVRGQMIQLLKTITMTYVSYEEQRYIAEVDFTDQSQIEKLIPLYSKRILDICNFFRKKRQGIRNVIRRNSFNGSIKSIEEVVYNKVVDWVLNRKSIPLAYKDIKNDLTVSVSNYVDTYAEYFDIPRDEEVQDKVRENYDMLTANMNTVDYRYFVEVSEVVAGILYSGDVYLKEIPLIAQLGLDLSQECVGDLLAMKNSLSYKATINRIDLTEQIDIKRRLYRKFIGVDLYYAYMDGDGNITMDLLCKADNPTGNLLNVCSADTATTPSGQLEELHKIGLYFKPDKCSILKVNARDYTWSFDTDNMEENSWYVFPDPSKYGDVGTNKQKDYPLLMTYKDTYDVRNISSGDVLHAPLSRIGDQNWRTYYSKSEDDLKTIDNTDLKYGFSSITIGIDLKEKKTISLKDYQQDILGNEYIIQTKNQIVLDKNINMTYTASCIDGKYYNAGAVGELKLEVK